ncbi:MAG: matrixin family metalloprotease, partial [Planctomycetes bacterium]|nr:matrixin family metalloprotease [Planctomycetota bacterium]
MPGLVVGALIGLASLQTQDAVAFFPTGQVWATPTAPYFVNPSFTDAAAGTAAQQIAAIQRAASEWKSAGQIPFQFIYAGTTAVNFVAPGDGVNAIFYSPGANGGGALATTTWSFDNQNKMTGFDMQFFDFVSNINPVWAINPNFSQFDIEGVAVHEFGHAIGLAHSGVANATMFPSVNPGSISARTLDADDISGVQSLYGVQATGMPSLNQVSPWHDHVDS